MLNRRPRRQMNQMNVVPYIDVMLVLLVIFMVTTPMFSPGVVDVPSVSHARTMDAHPVEIVMDRPDHIVIRGGTQPDVAVASPDLLIERVREMAANDQPFAISASQELKYADVIRVADALHKAGIKRVALTVKQ